MSELAEHEELAAMVLEHLGALASMLSRRVGPLAGLVLVSVGGPMRATARAIRSGKSVEQIIAAILSSVAKE